MLVTELIGRSFATPCNRMHGVGTTRTGSGASDQDDWRNANLTNDLASVKCYASSYAGERSQDGRLRTMYHPTSYMCTQMDQPAKGADCGKRGVVSGSQMTHLTT